MGFMFTENLEGHCWGAFDMFSRTKRYLRSLDNRSRQIKRLRGHLADSIVGYFPIDLGRSGNSYWFDMWNRPYTKEQGNDGKIQDTRNYYKVYKKPGQDAQSIGYYIIVPVLTIEHTFICYALLIIWYQI